MKLRNHYIEKYREQKKELEATGELWRICVESEEEFIEKLDDIFIETLMFDFINDFQRENTIKGKIHVLLQKKLSKEEWKEEIKLNEKETEIADKEAIPVVREILKTITTPLEWENIVKISKWIWRKQIKFDDLNHDLQNEFKKTSHYERLKRENKLNRKTLDEE
ncbi:hypothetical protein [[Muricauda] lutisoli]|uniref:Uncharacterized protein n=1 Tax=[Muricauda] lutisoli TaxID=2816035 RepID=A0ABS3EUA9_9FLAO|nr:hypothetical protein [[Muricauda] lutisoli]MBO0329740.1 hypothetical protein [[Muricauda] lutisoli]